MKKNNLLLLFICFSIFAQSQCVDSDDPKLNVLRTPLGSTVNSWDWTDTKNYWAYFHNESGSPLYWQMPSPFDASGSVDKNTEYLRVLQDNKPTEGWELVLKNFGSSSAGVTVPHFILYNRYQGLLRVLFYRKNRHDGNSAKIQVRFKQPISGDNKVSALLDHLTQPTSALDAFSKTPETSIINFVDIDGNFWLCADILVAYDPCTCHHYTQLYIEPTLLRIEEMSIKMNGGTIPLVTNGTPVAGNQGLFASIDNFRTQLEPAISKGQAWGKTLSNVADFINNIFLPQFNTRANKSVYEYGDWNPKYTIEPEVLPAVLKAPWLNTVAPYLGYAMALFPLLVGGGKSEPAPFTPTKYEFTMKGTTTVEQPMKYSAPYVPGSAWKVNGVPISIANLRESQPIYDNTLGVFALTETPNVLFSQSSNANGNDGDPVMISRAFKLNSPIKYAVNPAAGLKLLEVKAALVLSGDIESGAQAVFTPNSTPIKITQGNKGDDTLILHTPFLPLSCINNYTIHLNHQEGVVGHSMNNIWGIEEKIRLQIIATFERVDNPLANRVVFNAQYKTKLVPVSYPLESTELSAIPISVELENLVLTEDKMIKAWETVTIKGNVQLNGHQLSIVAGQAISIDPAILSPQIDLKIGMPTECQGNVPPQTPKQLYSFCRNKYDPKVPIKSKETSAELLERYLKVAPNPFSSELKIDFVITEFSDVTLSMTNAVGQVIQAIDFPAQQAGDYQHIIRTTDIAPGVYFLTLKTKYCIETQKIVKQL